MVEEENRRYLVGLITEEFRTVSRDRTNLSRSYCTSGDISFYDKYLAILNWGGGEIPNSTTSNSQITKYFQEDQVSHREIFQKLEITDEEKNFFHLAEEYSNELTLYELQAMESVKQGKIVSGPLQPLENETIQQFVLRSLYGQLYASYEDKIADNLERFQELNSIQMRSRFTASKNIFSSDLIIQSAMLLVLALVFALIIKMLSEQMSRQSLENQKVMLDSMPLGCIIRDSDSKLIDCNKVMISLFGFQDLQDANARFSNMSPEYQPNGKTSQEYAFEVQEIAKATGAAQFRWIFINKYGDEFPSKVTLINARLNNNNYTVAYIRDVSQEEEATRAIVESEAKLIAYEESGHRLQQMINAIPVGVALFDDHLNFFDCNEAQVTLFGVKTNEEFQERFFELSPEFQPNGRLSSECAEEKIRDVLKSGYEKFEWLHMHLDGTLIPMEMTIKRIQLGGEYIFVGCSRDLREEKALKAEVDKMHQQMRLMLDATPLACILWDANFKFIDCNLETVRLFELSSREEYDSNTKLSPEYQPNGKPSKELSQQKIISALDTGYERFEWTYQNKNGDLIPTEVTLVRLQLQDQTLIGGYIRDLREEKSLQESLRRIESLRATTNEIADILMSQHLGEFRVRMRQCLRLVAEVTKTDRISIYRNYYNRYGELCFHRMYVWLSEKTRPCNHWEACEAGVSYNSTLPNWVEILSAGETITCSVEDVQTDDKNFLMRCGIMSMVAVPIMIRGEFWGFVRFADAHHKRDFLEGEVEVLSTCADIFASAIIQNDTQSQLAKRNVLSTTVNKIADILASISNWNIFERIEESLGLLGKVLELDRVSISKYEVREDGSMVAQINYEYTAEGIPSHIWNKLSIDDFEPDDYQYWLDETLKRHSVSFHRSYITGKSREYCEKTGIFSLFSIPIFVEEKFWGLMRLENCRFEQRLSESEIEVIETCAHLLAVTILEHETKSELADSNLKLIFESERANKLAEAEKLAEIKTQFLANMSHEIRTPMNAIVGMSGLLMEEKMTPKQQSYVGDIKQSADTLLTIINDLLDFSKLEAGKMELVPKHYNFNEMLDNVISTLNFIAQNKGLALILEKVGDVPDFFYGDEVRLKQTLWNLIGNALKFTKQGEVKLVITDLGTQLKFDVIDTGIGIREEDLPKLFEAFTQVDQQHTSYAKGTGLGLSICKSIVELMGGTIYVTSVYGEGATFTFVIPKQVGDTNKIREQIAVQGLTIDHPAKILVVDDNEINLNVANGIFGSFGADIDTAISGRDAIQKVRQNTYDIIFMDHMMPEMDGLEATKQIRLLGEQYEKLPIIALSANAVQGAREMFLASGMNGFVSKPIEKIELIRALVEFLPREKYMINTSSKQEDAEEVNEVVHDLKTRITQRMPELNVSLGLVRTGGNWDVFVTTLKMLIRKTPGHIENLYKYLENDEIHSYAIEIHGLKGVLAGLGCETLASEAAKLEHAAKNGNPDYCIENNGSFAKKLTDFGNNLTNIFTEVENERQAQKELGDIKRLEESIQVIKLALTDYDTSAVTEKVAELLEYEYGADIYEKLIRLKESAEEFDYDNAQLLLEELVHNANKLVIEQINNSVY
ncbi:MAG: ATP-binding protein [Thermoguttaceae bacterium]